MPKQFKSKSLLTVENIKTILDTERLLDTRNDTLIVQFASGRRIMKREPIVSTIHDVREGIGWGLAQQFGAIEELLIVGRIGTTTIERVNFRKFPFLHLGYLPISIRLSGRNAASSWFAEAHQDCDWNEEGKQTWKAPSPSVATKQSRDGLGYILDNIYRGADCYLAFNSKNLM